MQTVMTVDVISIEWSYMLSHRLKTLRNFAASYFSFHVPYHLECAWNFQNLSLDPDCYSVNFELKGTCFTKGGKNDIVGQAVSL